MVKEREKKNCTLLSESPVSTLWKFGKKPLNLQKFWQGIASLPEQISSDFQAFCNPLLSISWYRYVWISADFIRFCGKKLKKHGKKCRKMPYFGSKTSDFLDRNIRTFDAKPPYFVAKKSDVSGFPAGKCAEIPFSRFCDISVRGKAWWLPRPFSAR